MVQILPHLRLFLIDVPLLTRLANFDSAEKRSGFRCLILAYYFVRVGRSRCGCRWGYHRTVGWLRSGGLLRLRRARASDNERTCQKTIHSHGRPPEVVPEASCQASG